MRRQSSCQLQSCEYYHNQIKGNKFRHNTQRTPPINTYIYSATSQQQRSYADVIKSNTNWVEDTAITLTKLLDEIKGLFNQLFEQNRMILNMLTRLINKTN